MIKNLQNKHFLSGQRAKKMQWLLIFFLLTAPIFLQAQDLGILTDQSVAFNNLGADYDDSRLSYSGSIIPYFSTLIGSNSELNIAASLTYRIEPWFYVPELLMMELNIRFGKGELKAGRMKYSDPMEFIANGYFDGALFAFDTKAGTFSVGGWYTGYLYKTRAAITMTKDEERYSYESYFFDDFVNTYFAPARLLSSISWGHTSIGGLLDLKLSLLGQFDFSGANLDSQYVTLNLSIPAKRIIFNLGGCFELIQYDGLYEGFLNSTMAVAAKAGLTWTSTKPIEPKISLQGIYASAGFKDTPYGSFLPVTTIPQGNLLNAKLTGISIISINFLTSFSDTVSIELDVSYFIRNDLETYNYYPVIGTSSEGHFLGPEMFTRFLWKSASGFHLNIGAGVFMPSLGDAAPEGNMLWRVEASILLSLF